MDFINIKELNKYLNTCVNDVLQKEVFTDVSNEIQKSIQKDVYEAYTPTSYIRTGEMKSPELIHKEMLGNGVMKITHKRIDGTKNVSNIIEKGIGYTWINSSIYKSQPFPRKFMKGTTFRIKNKNIHLIALKKGLKRFGLKLV